MDLKILADMPPWDWPRDTAETFKKALRDRGSSLEDRVLAAEMAGNMVVVNNEIADLLSGIVRAAEEPAELRARAAIALGPVLEHSDIDEFHDTIDEPPITEDTFDRIQATLQAVYRDETVPKEVRRRVVEASVRSPQDWHPEAIRAGYASGDDEWKLTAVFAMQYVKGFDKEILEALDDPNPDIHFEAVRAAGDCGVEAAWPHVEKLINSSKTEKRLLLAAIEASGAINLEEARDRLYELRRSKDEDIVEAVEEALMMGEPDIEEDEDEEEELGGGGYVN